MMQTQPDNIDPLWTVMREGGPFHARGHLEAYCNTWSVPAAAMPSRN